MILSLFFFFLTILAFVKNVDNSKLASAGTSFGKFSPKEAVGCIMKQFKASGWVHGIAFSPSGNQCAWVTRSSTIDFLSCETTDLRTQTLKLRGLVCVGYLKRFLFLPS